MSKKAIQQAAERLAEAVTSGTPVAPIRDLIELSDVNSAYAIQAANVQKASAAGRRISGKKIGLTSPAVRMQFGVFEPDYGVLFADCEFGHNDEIPMKGLFQPRCEAEIALVLGQDLDHPQVTYADVIRATEYVLPAIEIVDSRIANWDIKLVDTIADNASFGRYVLGATARRLEGHDLAAMRMRLLKNGEEVSTGQGQDCMGHPINAAAWLARTMFANGAPLRRGDVVMTGALGPMRPAVAGDSFTAEIEGLGQVGLRFAGQA
jgi:2-keto-4-pentenoate hydratase